MAASPHAYIGALVLLGLSVNVLAEVGFSVDATDRNERVGYRESRLQLDSTPSTPQGTHWLAHHNYRVFALPEVNGSAAAANGHVHTLALHGQRSLHSWQLELAPVLAVSSNILRNLKTLSLSDWQLQGSAVRAVDLSSWGSGMWGVRVDSRLGDYRPYPTAQWRQAFSNGSQLALGVPDSSALWRWHPQLTMRLSLGPDGGQWRVRDDALRQAGELRQRRWHSSLAVEWQLLASLRLRLGASYYFRERWRYQLSDGAKVRLNRPNHTALWLGIAVVH
ncbi:hypothetical protein [Marinobacter sp. SS21]|uniref:hypothetical protein n=1 Tax=Marinobacter sp. SS21 TaxID=2979460 RepID=UPI00232FB31E|nr:hypothetical protein [Marinobacter sp. SS21]MDC0661517.1 hypothetical protein [Marinobacter sp. SS21]